MEKGQDTIEGFNWRRMLLPEEFEWSFLGEVAFRTVIMFVVLLLFFKLSGKKSINQLSLFEIAIIVGLGSAAGDPMFYDDVGLLPVFVVFIVISVLYRLLTYVTLKSDKLEQIIEGKVNAVFENGLMVTRVLDSEALSYDEFFGFLRIQHVEHLGQIRAAFLEINGEISVFFQTDDQVKPGLPILPDALKYTYRQITSEGMHSCTRCGYTDLFKAGQEPLCTICGNNNWIRSASSRRIA